MLNAIDVPFDASKYAFRTNFDGLTMTDNSISSRLEDAKKSYQNALTEFESKDKKAREAYKADKDEGCPDDFGTWVTRYDRLWSTAKADLQGRGAQLTQTAMFAFGQAYQEKLQKDQSAFNNAAFQAGHNPEFI
ncbi:hypothetical protein DTO271G3_1259 [Paecilomyces variotii]|nr:hypothetical protein DTO271G3_1259 [Paecilomyces variotii]